MEDVLSTLLDGLKNAVLMAYEVWWALVLGLRDLGDRPGLGPARADRGGALRAAASRPVAKATGLGAASSSCSYAAIAIAKSLFQKGASAATALAFQFASTNLVWELGLVLWVLIGWQFTLAEYVGGIVMIALMTAAAAALRLPAARGARRAARAAGATPATSTTRPGERMTWRQRLTSLDAWTDVAHNFRGDWQMLWKEITIGFLLAGFIGLLGDDFFNGLFIDRRAGGRPDDRERDRRPDHRGAQLRLLDRQRPARGGALVRRDLFAGVIAFIFADLIVLPIVLAYRKYYGTEFALRITALMFVTMVLAALIVDGLFCLAGLIPTARPARTDVFGSVELDYKLVLNVLGLAIFAGLFYLTVRRGDEATRAHGGAEGVAATTGR